MSYERMTCRLCMGRVWTTYTFEPTPIANLFPKRDNEGELFPLSLKQCEACQHVQIGHVIEDSVLYGANYKYSTPSALTPKLRDRAVQLRKEYPDAELVLEIGANNGMFLRSLYFAGFPRFCGIDPSSKDAHVWAMPFDMKAAKIVRNNVQKADLIVANNVFAHIDDLQEVFRAIDYVLSDDGAVVFEVQYLIPMMLFGTFDMVYHEHRDYHHLAPIASFLRSFDMVMTDWEILDDHAGSIRVTAKRSGKQKPLPKEDINWRDFDDAIEANRRRLLSALPDRIAAFGAPAKATTLIHHFGIKDRIRYCVDDTPQKQGTFLAGTSIPVFDRNSMEKKMLLLSWNYADIIKKQFPDVEFILPFDVREVEALAA